LELDKKQIALDNKLWFEWFLKIKEELPNAECVNASNVVIESRLIKSEDEISLIHQATEIASNVIIRSFREISTEMIESDVANLVKEKLTKFGGQTAFSLMQSVAFYYFKYFFKFFAHNHPKVIYLILSIIQHLLEVLQIPSTI